MSFKNQLCDITLKFDGEDILAEGYYVLKSLTLYYEDRKLPRFEVVLAQKDNNIVFSKKEGELELTFDDQYKIISKLTVNESNIAKNFIGGLLLESKHSNETKIQFLGDDLKSAIESLGYSHELQGLQPIVGEYFQWNETDNEVLIPLLNGCKKDTFICITEDLIAVVDSPSEFHDAIIGSQIINEVENFYDEALKDMQQKSYLNDMDAPEGSTIFYNSLAYGASTSGEYLENFLYNERYRRPPRKLYDSRYNDCYIPYKIGEGVKFKVQDVDTQGVVIGKIIEITPNTVHTTLRLGEI